MKHFKISYVLRKDTNIEHRLHYMYKFGKPVRKPVPLS